MSEGAEGCQVFGNLRTWGAAVLRPYKFAANGKISIVLSLSPATWEAIARTG
jgi:hypothetical protein